MAAATYDGIVNREAIIQAFERYAIDAYPTLTELGHGMAKDALEELTEITVALFDYWYMHNSYRYRKMREIDRRKARQAARFFVLDFSLGKIEL